MTHSTEQQDWDSLRAGVIGLGSQSARKSYFPELQKRLGELERFRALLDSTNDAIMLLELPGGLILDANSAAARLLGISGAGNTLAETTPASFAQEVLRRLALDEGVRIEVELGRSGAPFEVDARPLSMPDGDFAVVVARDIAERRRSAAAELAHRRQLEDEVASRTEELRRSNEELLQATRAKDRFLASMSHELRTPLNSVIGFSDILLSGLAGEVNEEQVRQLVMVNNAGKHLLSLINQVLDLAKIEAGQAEVISESFDPCDLVEDVVGLVSAQAESHGLSVVAVCEPGAPRIVSDRQRVLQILLNLAGNAVKFTSSGEVRLSLECEQDVLVFRVHDTGPGIAPHEQRHIWEPFRQGAIDGGIKPPGTGLGLSISLQLAELLGGSLELERSSQAGSVFTLRLPHMCEVGSR